MTCGSFGFQREPTDLFQLSTVVEIDPAWISDLGSGVYVKKYTK
jgi:hypothetical protein